MMRLLIIGSCFCALISLAGCEDATVDEAPALTEVEPPSERQMQLWSRSCALCHVSGTGGAPRMGVPEEWADRVEQGSAVLLERTIEGFNNMPPLGYCMACEEDDFVALIEFMSGGSR